MPANPERVPKPRQTGREISVVPASDEPGKDEIIQNIRVGMRQALAGETRPAREALDEIRSKIATDADTR